MTPRSQPFILAAVLALATSGLKAQEPKSASGTLAILAGRIHIGNGEVVERGYLVVRDGKVVSVHKDKPADATIIDASQKVIMPGIVAADSDLATPRDNEYNVTPDFVAVEGFDFMRKYPAALSGGVTAAYLSPSRRRFVSGQGSVVKLAGKGLLDRVLAEKASLRVALGRAAAQAPSLFEPEAAPTADNPLKPARRQYPSARLSQLAELRRIFDQAQDQKIERLGSGSAENRYSPQPLRDVVSGKLRLRIGAEEAADLSQAIRFARKLGVSLVLENPFAIEQLLQLHSDAPPMMVCRMPIRPGQANAGGENRLDDSTKNDPRNAILARAAGATVALVPATDQDLSDYLLIAGMAVRFGMKPAEALASITLDAARVLGVDGQVGSLEVGKDADFLVLSGEPFSIGTMVEDTFINGERVWHRKAQSDLLVVRASRIITCEGQTIENGSVIVAGNKIKGVGRDLAVPYGARVIDLGDAVIVPGFVDAYSHAGLSGEGSSIPRGAADQRLTDVIDPQDPILRQVAAAGLTTVLVSGTDSGLVSGRVAAIKTAAADRESMVLRNVAAIRFVHDAITENGIAPLAGEINKGKAYIAQWQKYEKDLAAFKAGKKPASAPVEAKPADATTEKPAGSGQDPISGTWGGAATLEQPRPGTIPLQLDLKLDGSKVSGSIGLVARRRGQTAVQRLAISNGSFAAGKILLESAQDGRSAKIEGTVANGKIDGSFEMSMGPMKLTGKFTAERGAATPGPGGSTASTSTSSTNKDKQEEPKKPTVNEALEPMRALLEKKIPAVITCTRARAIQQVIEWFEKEKLPYVLSAVRDAIDTPEILGSAQPAVLLGPDVVSHKKGKIRNAAARLTDHGLPVALVSGATGGASYLPLHAANAIRYGMDPEEALKALTIYPARMFRLDDRIGSLKRGKDADFVAFSGSPFEMTSRVQLVVVNGQIVVDNRKVADKEGR